MQKSNPFDVSIGIKIPFLRVSVTIEPGSSLLKVRYHELFDLSSVPYKDKSFCKVVPEVVPKTGDVAPNIFRYATVKKASMRRRQHKYDRL